VRREPRLDEGLDVGRELVAGTDALLEDDEGLHPLPAQLVRHAHDGAEATAGWRSRQSSISAGPIR
jgi:hypothetical protein